MKNEGFYNKEQIFKCGNILEVKTRANGTTITNVCGSTDFKILMNGAIQCSSCNKIFKPKEF